MLLTIRAISGDIADRLEAPSSRIIHRRLGALTFITTSGVQRFERLCNPSPEFSRTGTNVGMRFWKSCGQGRAFVASQRDVKKPRTGPGSSRSLSRENAQAPRSYSVWIAPLETSDLSKKRNRSKLFRTATLILGLALHAIYLER
jgi:hypothetical protein